MIASCGGYGTSKLVVVSGFDSESVQAEVVFTPDSRSFFEGCTTVGDRRLVVLTWREKTIFEFELPSFKLVRKVSYPHDGWGITFDESRNLLWASDGSSRLHKLDPTTLKVVGHCEVHLSHDGKESVPVKYMNELEMVNGRILANIYMETSRIRESPNYIVSIDPEDCRVDRVIPLFGLGTEYGPGNVINGIATGSRPDEIFVTGKMWKSIHAVRLGPLASSIDPLWIRHNITDFLKINLGFR